MEARQGQVHRHQQSQRLLRTLTVLHFHVLDLILPITKRAITKEAGSVQNVLPRPFISVQLH